VGYSISIFVLFTPEYASNHIHFFKTSMCILSFSDHVILGFCCINLEIQDLVTPGSFIAKLLLGNVLKEGTPISLNPLVIWAWAGLLINAINSIPAGQLDGGRISFAIWGRKVCHL
jgi:membrane-associated protease RseP (regulator of RpoE activity)